MTKTIVLGLIVHFLILNKLFSQTEYMPVGTKSYGFASGFLFSGSYTVTSEKDTFCEGIPCRKIVQINQSTSPPGISKEVYFSRQVKDSIFYWNSSARKFELVFRTNMAVGDSIVFTNPFNSNLKTILYADSVKTINSVRITKCHRKCFWYDNLQFEIYDRFGTSDNLSTSRVCNGASDVLFFTPICFKDNQIFYTTSNYNGSNCGLVTDTHENNSLNMSVSPNPTQNYLDIQSNDNHLIERCSLIDALGHIYQEKEFNHAKSAHWVLNNIQNGIYFLKIETSLGHSIVKKIVVHQ